MITEYQEEQEQPPQKNKSSDSPSVNSIWEKLIITSLTLLFTSGILLTFGVLFTYYLSDESKYDNCSNRTLLNWCQNACISCFFTAFLIVIIEFFPQKQNWQKDAILFSSILSYLLQVIFVAGIYFNMDSKCGSLNKVAFWFCLIGLIMVITIPLLACLATFISGIIMIVCAFYDARQRQQQQQMQQQQYHLQE